MGRKALPQEILKLRGTDRKDRQRPSSVMCAPITLEDIGRCQVSGLKGATPRAREIYWSTCKKVAVQGILDEAYLPQLLFYAVEYDHFITCCEAIKRDGIYMISAGENGVPSVVVNPAVKQRDSALDKIIKIGSNFGFSPVDRQKLKVEVDDKDKKLKGVLAAIFEDADDVTEER